MLLSKYRVIIWFKKQVIEDTSIIGEPVIPKKAHVEKEYYSDGCIHYIRVVHGNKVTMYWGVNYLSI